ncbi:hypothetical protein C1X59_19245 [Pseudomonas sp. FW215-R2]|uniref:hypothetical protein n=1 Tax=unclassified Pseudomonas TaxID=196821 RepID=UPI000C87FE8B|nr:MULTISPECIES: hypothetical protein [unclassified Pseudomonas]PMW98976.1 hypothetical protein C1X59_19245 [Pseudomonas sp. FW215-R2]PMX04667.1 hypothetical protein C1X60_29900 [Pseudomonas sp. FW215-L1]PMX15236.1 hypothetical protein C1X57_29965 [Pseudomonas sp. FW215-E1]PNA20227.1 hypothetical protein C1X58_29945 [Pseudomonas sp. FW215-R4]
MRVLDINNVFIGDLEPLSPVATIILDNGEERTINLSPTTLKVCYDEDGAFDGLDAEELEYCLGVYISERNCKPTLTLDTLKILAEVLSDKRCEQYSVDDHDQICVYNEEKGHFYIVSSFVDLYAGYRELNEMIAREPAN